MRLPYSKSKKWPLWRHPFQNSELQEKCHWQICSRSFVESFIKVGPSVWAVARLNTQTHTHRERRTDTQTPSIFCNIFSQNWLTYNYIHLEIRKILTSRLISAVSLRSCWRMPVRVLIALALSSSFFNIMGTALFFPEITKKIIMVCETLMPPLCFLSV